MPPTASKTTRREISPITRAEMLGMHKAGASLRTITGLIVLEDAYQKLLPEMLDDFPARVFMQDNARTHILGATTDWLKLKGYTVRQILTLLKWHGS